MFLYDAPIEKSLDPGDVDALWIGACAHHLHRRWRTIDPAELEEMAATLARDPALRTLPPEAAVGHWLRPITDHTGVATMR